MYKILDLYKQHLPLKIKSREKKAIKKSKKKKEIKRIN